MSPEAADQRIIYSRQTQARYMQMIDAGTKPVADLPMMEREIAILVDLAVEHPGKAAKIASLIGQWRDLMEKVRTVH